MGDEKGDNLELQTLLSENGGEGQEGGGDAVGPKEAEDLGQGKNFCLTGKQGVKAMINRTNLAFQPMWIGSKVLWPFKR